MSLKQRIYNIIQPHKTADIPSMVFDWSIVFLIIINICIIIFDTLDLPGRVSAAFKITETVIIIIFTAEYLLRLWTADMVYKDAKMLKAVLKYAFTFVMLMDFIAIMPFYFQVIFHFDINILRIFRFFRMIWFFKIKRQYIKVLSDILDVFRQKAAALFFSIFIIFIMMIVASILMYNAEKHAQPEQFGDALSGLWWAVITLTTVGYGDIYPVTALGKVIGAFFSIISIGFIAVPTGIISSGFIEKSRGEKSEYKKNKHFCPYCGNNIEE